MGRGAAGAQAGSRLPRPWVLTTATCWFEDGRERGGRGRSALARLAALRAVALVELLYAAVFASASWCRLMCAASIRAASCA